MTKSPDPRVLDALLRAVDEVNATLPGSQKLARASDLILHGEGSALDSLSFINLLIAAEESLEAIGPPPQLTVILETVPPERYRTLADLARFVEEAMENRS